MGSKYTTTVQKSTKCFPEFYHFTFPPTMNESSISESLLAIFILDYGSHFPVPSHLIFLLYARHSNKISQRLFLILTFYYQKDWLNS